VQQILLRHQDLLKSVYTKYAQLDQQDTDDLDEMNLVEFLLFAEDSGLMDPILTQTCIVNIFVYVQDGDLDKHDAQEKSEGEGVQSDRQLNYSEFCEALCGCSCYKVCMRVCMYVCVCMCFFVVVCV
jgi:hypothetical protein